MDGCCSVLEQRGVAQRVARFARCVWGDVGFLGAGIILDFCGVFVIDIEGYNLLQGYNLLDQCYRTLDLTLPLGQVF